MHRHTPLVAAALFALSTGPAFAFGGGCSLDALKIRGSYGFAAAGIATAATPFAPVGPFTQAGTVTHNPTGETLSTITGTWNVLAAQNDTVGYTATVTFGGTFTVNKSTCAGEFFLTTPITLPTPAFHVIFVSDGAELRTISAIKGLQISYTTAAKL